MLTKAEQQHPIRIGVDTERFKASNVYGNVVIQASHMLHMIGRHDCSQIQHMSHVVINDEIRPSESVLEQLNCGLVVSISLG